MRLCLKKTTFVLFAVLITSILASCSTVAISFEDPTIDLTIDGEDVANVIIVPYFEGKSGLLTVAGTKGFAISVENKINSVIKIVWEKSSVYYEGKSSIPFITGQKYIDHNSPMSPTIIPAHGKTTTNVYSADQVYYVSGRYGGWRMSNIPSFNTQLLLCIESGGKESYYTFSIQGNPILPPEK